MSSTEVCYHKLLVRIWDHIAVETVLVSPLCWAKSALQTSRKLFTLFFLSWVILMLGECYDGSAEPPSVPKSGRRKSWRGTVVLVQPGLALLRQKKNKPKSGQYMLPLLTLFPCTSSQLHHIVFLGSSTGFGYSITGGSFKIESKIHVYPGLPADH